MQSVAVDHANPEPGEEAFILQLCLPDTPGADGGALMDKIGSFVGLYLGAAQPDSARFAQMGDLTWVIAAPGEAAAALDQVRADLAQTLYGVDDGTQVKLEWPGGVAPAAPDAAEAVEPDMDEDEAWSTNASTQAELVAETAAEPETGADALDLDIDAFELETPSGDEPEPGRETPQNEADEVFVIDEPAVDIGDDPFDQDADPAELSADDETAASEDWDVATAAQRAAFDDDTDVFEVDALDIEIVDGPGLASDPDPDTDAATGPMDVDLDAPLEVDALGDLTEAPDRPEPNNVSAELETFRAEMREIAASIPGATSDETLAEFRAELDAIAGAMGQRVDGAAQRIEAAADRVIEETAGLNGERLAAAAERAEQSAKLLETGVSDALSVLSAAARAMSELAFLTASKAKS
jgi:hypothetical protein